MRDRCQREIDYLRISLTDRCNLGCRYCMPTDAPSKIDPANMLTLEEILHIARLMAELGIKKLRLTGGEPLLRPGVCQLVRDLKRINGIDTVALTTNGVRLAEMAEELKEAGLDEVNISLDTLRAETFSRLTGRPLLPQVLAGLAAAERAGFQSLKLNCVPIKGVNDDEVVPLATLAQRRKLKVRYIALMPIGCGAEPRLPGLPLREAKQVITTAFGPMRRLPTTTGANGPAVYFKPKGFLGEIGFIDALDHKFCAQCNRIRLTSEGFLKLCLYGKAGIDVRPLLRSGLADEAFRQKLRQAIYEKPVEHYFGGPNDQGKDSRRMYQVGG